MVELVVHPATLLASAHDPRISERCHVMGERWLGDLEFREQAAGALLFAVP